MLNYIEYLNMPTKLAIGLAVLFFLMQIIGEILEFKGKIVPEFLNVRKYFKRKKAEREALAKMPSLMKSFKEIPEALNEVKILLNDVNQHYSNDNIMKRDCWIKEVNEHITLSEVRRCEQDALMRALNEKLDKNNADTLSLLIDNKRNAIINFASHVIDENSSVTREQFNRIFKIYEEYEDIIETNGLTNGEVDIAYRIITESYEKHMRNHTFIEDIRGYN